MTWNEGSLDKLAFEQWDALVFWASTGVQSTPDFSFNVVNLCDCLVRCYVTPSVVSPPPPLLLIGIIIYYYYYYYYICYLLAFYSVL